MTKVFYYFCQFCGSDTASYEMYEVCPYCHSGPQDLRLIADSIDANPADITHIIEQARAAWLTKHHTGTLSHRKPRSRHWR